MSDHNQLEQQIKRALRKVPRVRKVFLIIELWLKVVFYKACNFCPRTHIHWIGAPRPKRRERLFFVTVIFGAMAALETNQFLLWSIFWGWMTSVYVIVQSVLSLIPRKEHHWVGKE